MPRATSGNLKSWRQKLREFRKSRLSREAFCEKNGIKKSRLDYWFARLGKRDKGTGLMELNSALPPTPGGCLEVIVAGSYRVEVHSTVDHTLAGSGEDYRQAAEGDCPRGIDMTRAGPGIMMVEA